MKIKEIKVKQSIFPQLDTDFPSENFHYSRNAAKGAMRCKMEISSHWLTRESALNCILLIAKCEICIIFLSILHYYLWKEREFKKKINSIDLSIGLNNWFCFQGKSCICLSTFHYIIICFVFIKNSLRYYNMNHIIIDDVTHTMKECECRHGYNLHNRRYILFSNKGCYNVV